MVVYHVAFKLTRGIEDDELVACDEHQFDARVELSDAQADRVWELLNEAAIDNTIAEHLEIDQPEPGAVADLAGLPAVETALTELSVRCVHV